MACDLGSLTAALHFFVTDTDVDFGSGASAALTATAAFGVAIALATAAYSPVYQLRLLLDWRRSSFAALAPLLIAFIAVSALMLDSGIGASAVASAGWAPLSVATIILFASRYVWTGVIEHCARSGWLAYRVAVVGTEAPQVLDLVGQHPSPFLQMRRIPDGDGSLRALTSHVRRHVVDAIILAYAPGEDVALIQSLAALRSVVPDILTFSRISRCGGLPPSHPLASLPLTSLQKAPMADRDIIVKGLIDRLGGVALCILLAPLLLATALAISLESPGPILFLQPRVGYNNRIFMMFKFRSMHDHQRDSRAKVQTTRDDHRITRVGRFIRRWSIDELPQLFNVIRGEMSLVGPRPHAPGTQVDGVPVAHVHPDYEVRHRVLPGITGWAQVNGSRGALVQIADVEQRLRLDLEYIDRWSLGFDLRILLLTLTSASSHADVY